MKRIFLCATVLCACIGFSPRADAQMGGGMNFFKKPNIADIFHPVVGEGATYEETRKDGAKSTIEMTITGRELADGKDAYWFEVGHPEKGSEKLSYAKMLVTKDAFEIKR